MPRAPTLLAAVALGAIAVGAIAVGVVGLVQLSSAVTGSSTDPPPAMIHRLADDVAAPLLRLLGNPHPAPADVAATIRFLLFSIVVAGLFLATCVTLWLGQERNNAGARPMRGG